MRAMDDEARPTARAAGKGSRPGGRSARVHAAVIAAAGAELAEHGYDAFSIPRVAGRAGVALTTLYRRWDSRARLVADVFVDQIGTAIPDPARGSVEEDLRTLATWVAASLDDPAAVALLISVQGLPEDEREAVRARYWASRWAVAGTIIDRAIAAGELPAGTASWPVVERINAPIWMRKLVTGLPVEPAFIDELVAGSLLIARDGD